MNANTPERAEWAAGIATRLRKAKTQKEAIKIAAEIVHVINSPGSAYQAGEKFKDALVDLWSGDD